MNLPASTRPEACQDKARGKGGLVCPCVCVFTDVRVLTFGDLGKMRVPKFQVIRGFYLAVNHVSEIDRRPGSGEAFSQYGL